MPETSQVFDLLRAKAMLLVGRERQIHELRLGRDRTRTWIDVFARLSENIPHESEQTLLERWVVSMVDGLGFQVAAAYRLHPGAAQLALLSRRAHRPLERNWTLDPEAEIYLGAHAFGHYANDTPTALKALSLELDLGSFYWMLFEAHERRTLLVSGFAPETSRYYVAREHDLDHFIHFGNHLGVLIRNALLIEQLAHESSELQATNTTLDRSLGELRETQRRLVESSRTLAEVSRRAGMADVATGVIHNVGNALNSVNVSMQVARERLQGMGLDGLTRVIELLGETPAPSADQLAQVNRYLKALTTHLETERGAVARELETLGDSVKHITAIVAAQQTHARAAAVTERCDPGDLFAEALSFVHDELVTLGISVHTEVSTFGPIRVDRHKVVQILVNLLTNAQYALVPIEARERAITIRVSRLAADRFTISVKDNGVGIAEEHRAQIFSHGFTTRVGGHGFGLPASAMAAQDLGGTLSFESAGHGQGATFTLELPIHPLEERARH